MVDKEVVESVQKALDESKKLDRKFKQNIDLVINLKNVDLEDAKNRIDEEIILPRGRGKESKIAIFASGELALKAKGKVDLIIKPEEIEDLAKDKKKFKKITDEGIVKNLRQTIRLRSKANKTFHAIAGKEEMGKEQIAENIDTIIKRLESKLERGRMNIGSIHVKTTMGPSVRII
jgi:large subunit ribosomal protein L1